jgi:hypothetical protein
VEFFDDVEKAGCQSLLKADLKKQSSQATDGMKDPVNGIIFETVHRFAGGKLKCRNNDLTQSFETPKMKGPLSLKCWGNTHPNYTVSHPRRLESSRLHQIPSLVQHRK